MNRHTRIIVSAVLAAIAGIVAYSLVPEPLPELSRAAFRIRHGTPDPTVCRPPGLAVPLVPALQPA